MEDIKFEKVVEGKELPKSANIGLTDVKFGTLYSSMMAYLSEGDHMNVKTGVTIKIPNGYRIIALREYHYSNEEKEYEDGTYRSIDFIVPGGEIDVVPDKEIEVTVYGAEDVTIDPGTALCNVIIFKANTNVEIIYQ